ALHTDDNAKKNDFLWPNSLPKALRRLSVIDNKPVEARRKLLNLLKEIRDYRNRLFHHDCIWIKIKTVDKQTAIESIREKINLIEKIITAISPVTNRALTAWGMYENARRICSTAELSIYTNLNYQVPNIATPGLLGQLMLQTNGGKETVPMMLQNEACVFYKLR
ncbi:CAAX protease, partial [Escherichia coli]|nr:CAAX protease [Escherichia coli]